MKHANPTPTPQPLSPIVRQLQTGASLKLSMADGHTYLVRDGREFFADKAEVQRLAKRGQLRPHGIDSKGNCVFALNTTPRRHA
ncbi:hypothetical protein [Paracidovorax wautersii]|uniref:hypothetical protein n=1 Tax=Paracidovorax wautersii TaxID=1177982 RepID=UPI0031D9C196